MRPVRLGEICTLNYGKALRGYESEPQEALPVEVFGTNGPIGWAKEPLSAQPAIIIGRKGAYRGVHYAFGPSWTIDTAYYLTIRDEDVDLSWLYYRLLIVDINRMDSGSAIPSTKREDFYGVSIGVPAFEKQKRIAAILSAYDNLIENNRRRIQLLEQAARLLYKEWFVHLRFPGHEHVNIKDGIPEGWRKIGLGDICKLRAGGTFKPKYQGQQEGDIPFIKVRDLNREGNAIAITGADNWVTLDECEEFRGKSFSRGTSVFAKIGEGLRQNRIRFIVRDTLIDNNMMGAIPDLRVTVSEYLYFFLQGHDLASYAGGAAIPFLSSKVLEGVGVLAPPMHLLLLFQDIVTPMFQQIFNLEQQSAAAIKARDLLLPKLMNGEVSV